MTKRITACVTCCFIIVLCSSSWGATLQLRNGQKLTGDVIAKTDDEVVLKTAAGVVTQQWRACTPASIKVLHPALYQRLVKEAQERKKKQEEEMAAKGMVNVGGKWISKEELQRMELAKVRLNVITTEKLGKFERMDRDGGVHKNYRRKNCGVIKVHFDGLNDKRQHTIRIRYTCYVNTPDFSDTRILNKDKEITKRITNQHTASFEFLSDTYNEYKDVLRGGWRYVDGGTQVRSTADIAGWDIKLWLNDTLVYERAREGQEHYHVTKF